MEDIFHSTQVRLLKQEITLSLEHDQEYTSLSIDATLKVCMVVLGQASYRAPASVRNAACFNDAESLRRVLTIRGRTGAVLGIVPIRAEDAPSVVQAIEQSLSQEALNQVKYISTDSPSAKLFQDLRAICPNLQCLCLDPVHLAIVYEYAQWGKRSPGSKVLRCLLNKINQTDPTCGARSWGRFYTGDSPPSLTREEERARASILNSGSIGVARSERILNSLDGSAPLFCRITFIETLAAICKKYSVEVSRKVTGTSKEVRKVLWAAASPDRMEWLFNGMRMRHSMDVRERSLLPSGTSSNESLHSQINSWSKSIRSLHQSTLTLKLDIMHFGKVLAHHVASCFPSLRQTQESVLLARALSTNIWTDLAWAGWCGPSSQKADLPLHVSRKEQAKRLKDWTVAKKPAADRPQGKVKRTVHTVKRKRSLRSAGCTCAFGDI